MFATDLVKELKTERKVYLVTPKDKLYYALEIIDCNRNVPQSNVNALKKSIEKNNALYLKPITIDNEYYIIDGQTRYKACQELNMPFYVDIVNSMEWSNEDLISINTTQRNWKLQDYLRYYVKFNTDSYIAFEQFLKLHKHITIQMLIAIFNKTNSRSHLNSKIFKNGELKYDNSNKSTILEWLGWLHQINEAPFYPSLNDRTKRNQEFQCSLLKKFQSPNWDNCKFVRLLSEYPHQLNKLKRITDFDQEIEDIYMSA
tara:strand:+ start:3091 stop:3864 length:774 start_codon:yes stop_codon:yes gene_type:complete